MISCLSHEVREQLLVDRLLNISCFLLDSRQMTRPIRQSNGLLCGSRTGLQGTDLSIFTSAGEKPACPIAAWCRRLLQLSV